MTLSQLEFIIHYAYNDFFEVKDHFGTSYLANKINIIYPKKPSLKIKIGSFIHKKDAPVNFKRIEELVTNYLSKRYNFGMKERKSKWVVKDDDGKIIYKGFFNDKRD